MASIQRAAALPVGAVDTATDLAAGGTGKRGRRGRPQCRVRPVDPLQTAGTVTDRSYYQGTVAGFVRIEPTN